MLDVVLAGIAGGVLAVLLSRPPKPHATPTPNEETAVVASAPVAAAAKPGRAKHTPNKWD